MRGPLCRHCILPRELGPYSPQPHPKPLENIVYLYLCNDKQKKQYVKDLVKVHNEAWNSTINDPSGLFDPTKLNFLIQKQVAGAMKQNAFAQDRFGFTDEKDFAKFQQLYTIILGL